MTKIERNKAKAIESYIKYLPGVHCTGDRWFCDWLDVTRSRSVNPDEASLFQLGIYTDNGGSYSDLTKVFEKFGVFPSYANPKFPHEHVHTERGHVQLIVLPLEADTKYTIYTPDNMEQAFKSGVALLEKYVDFSFPVSSADVEWLNTLLTKVNSLLRGTMHDTRSELWQMSFLEYTAAIHGNYVVLSGYSPYMGSKTFIPHHYLNSLKQLHRIAKAIGADTDYHMHHGNVNPYGVNELYLINEKQTV